MKLCVQCRLRPVKRAACWLCSRACANAARGRSVADRFPDFYHPGKPDACWPWTGTIHHRGYGVIGDNRNRQYSAHRLAYERAHGQIPKGLCVCHSCDNPPCVNPAHLFVGTNADNNADKARKGRAPKGEATHASKLTEADVRDIRGLYPRMSQQAIANRYGVHQSIISDVIRRETWKHVTD